jgi:hypothetical protein
MTEFFCVAHGVYFSTNGMRGGAQPCKFTYDGIVNAATAKEAYHAIIAAVAAENNVGEASVKLKNFNCMKNNP